MRFGDEVIGEFRHWSEVYTSKDLKHRKPTANLTRVTKGVNDMAEFATKFGQGRSDWETPDEIFIPLKQEFNFTIDVCASKNTAKCQRFYTKEIDGLSQNWNGDRCWMNPPFGKQGAWVKKAFEESKKGATVVCLLPARTNTNWWHDYCMKGNIRFIRGRPRFKGAKYGLPQPLAIVIFKGG